MQGGRACAASRHPIRKACTRALVAAKIVEASSPLMPPSCRSCLLLAELACLQWVRVFTGAATNVNRLSMAIGAGSLLVAWTETTTPAVAHLAKLTRAADGSDALTSRAAVNPTRARTTLR